MPRNYSESLLLSLNRADSDNPGIQLAQACIKAKLPAKYVSEVLNVSRMTIHSWFRGSPIRPHSKKLVEALVSLINKDLSDGRLPAVSIADAKAYLKSLTTD